MIWRLLLFISVLMVVPATAQTAASDSLQRGVDADARTTELVNKHAEINAKGKTKGYRVQIYFGVDNAKAKEVKSKFLSSYGTDAHGYVVYDLPNFKVRVGDFRTRMEAYRFLKKIKADFPSAFIVESEIELEDIH
ncbi:MAG: SPOR domain-containing protein [Bacteroidia bacterium]